MLISGVDREDIKMMCGYVNGYVGEIRDSLGVDRMDYTREVYEVSRKKIMDVLDRMDEVIMGFGSERDES